MTHAGITHLPCVCCCVCLIAACVLVSLPPVHVHVQASCEDNVLYTAQQYLDNLPPGPQQDRARQRLPLFIRCLHLSMYWLAASVVSGVLQTPPFDKYGKILLNYRNADPKHTLQELEVSRMLERARAWGRIDAPGGWVLPPRPSVRVESVELTWAVPVREVRAAAERFAGTQRGVTLSCKETTPPLQGVAWGMILQCDPAPGGAVIWVGCAPTSIQEHMTCSTALASVCLRLE